MTVRAQLQLSLGESDRVPMSVEELAAPSVMRPIHRAGVVRTGAQDNASAAPIVRRPQLSLAGFA